jgi:hypothetical protein
MILGLVKDTYTIQYNPNVRYALQDPVTGERQLESTTSSVQVQYALQDPMAGEGYLYYTV